MRLSADRKNPDFWGNHFETLNVMLDGVEVTHCVYADDDLGMVEVCMWLALGGLQVCVCGEHIMTGLRFGAVSFVGRVR